MSKILKTKKTSSLARTDDLDKVVDRLHGLITFEIFDYVSDVAASQKIKSDEVLYELKKLSAKVDALTDKVENFYDRMRHSVFCVKNIEIGRASDE